MGKLSTGARDRLVWWIFSAVLIAGVVFSTGLHLTLGPESALSSRWYSDVATAPQLQSWYGDRDLLTSADSGTSAWRLTSFSGDAGFYLRQAEHPEDSISPYQYRLVVPMLAALVATVSGQSIAAGFIMVNLAAIVAAGLLLQWHLERHHRVGRVPALLGAVLLVTTIPVTATVGMPMVDPTSVLVGVGLLVALYQRRWLLAGVVGAAGVLVKEVAVIAAPLIIIAAALEGRPTVRRATTIAVAALLPVLAYSVVRLVMGGGALEVNYGVNPISDGLPWYWERLLTEPAQMMLAVALAFGPLWLGLVGARLNRQLRVIVAASVAMVLAATFVLSSQTGRVLGILAPFLVVGVVLLVEHWAARADGRAAVQQESSASV